LKHLSQNPNDLLRKIQQLENQAAMPLVDLDGREDIPVEIRLNESVGPAMFKPDPFILGGYMANSLTIKAMRPDIFVLGDSLDDLAVEYECACGSHFDLQFWKLCPYCAREIKL
jgi:hypothetical protein